MRVFKSLIVLVNLGFFFWSLMSLVSLYPSKICAPGKAGSVCREVAQFNNGHVLLLVVALWALVDFAFGCVYYLIRDRRKRLSPLH